MIKARRRAALRISIIVTPRLKPRATRLDASLPSFNLTHPPSPE